MAVVLVLDVCVSLFRQHGLVVAQQAVQLRAMCGHLHMQCGLICHICLLKACQVHRHCISKEANCWDGLVCQKMNALTEVVSEPSLACAEEDVLELWM